MLSVCQALCSVPFMDCHMMPPNTLTDSKVTICVPIWLFPICHGKQNILVVRHAQSWKRLRIR